MPGQNSQQLHFDIDSLRDCLEIEQPRMLIWCSPHNPGGRVWTRGELCQVAALCKELDVIILSDEIHCDLTLWGLQHVPMALACKQVGYDGVITTCSPGKTWNLAGLQCGFVVLEHDDMRRKYLSIVEHQFLHFGSVFATVAMMAAYSKGGPWCERLCRYIESQILWLELFMSTSKHAFALLLYMRLICGRRESHTRDQSCAAASIFSSLAGLQWFESKCNKARREF